MVFLLSSFAAFWERHGNKGSVRFFTAVGIRKNIISSIPKGLKQSIATSAGVFVAIIGLYLAHIVVYDNRVLNYKQLSFSSFSTHYAYVLYVGLFVSAILGWPKLRFAGGMIIAIVIAAVLCHVWGINGSLVPDIKHNPFEAVGQLELSLLWHPMFWSPILVFFILDFMEGIGVIVGLTSKTTIQDKDGNIPNFGRGLYVDGGGTVLGSLLGTSSLIIFVESAVGIKAGGRTGLTAIICGLLMAASIMFAPIITLVPAEAAAGVLLYVGYLLLPVNVLSAGNDEYDRFDIICSLVMGSIIVFSFSLDKAMAVGFWAYFLRSVWRREAQSGAYWLGVIAVILTFSIVWQFLVLPHP
jgi:AGZA family xanthine/uracil permease-like MFS transporter